MIEHDIDIQLRGLRSAEALIRFGTKLLREEREVILSGAYDRLESLAAEKLAFLAEIERRASTIDRDMTSPERKVRFDMLHGVTVIFSRRAEENQRLLASALKGTRQAMEDVDGPATPAFYAASGDRIAPARTRAPLARI